MSAVTAIQATSLTLQKLLGDAIIAEFGGPPVYLQTPKEMQLTKGVSLWLYRVVRDEFLTNQPPQRISPTQLRRTPLPVTLHYLVTPMLDDSENEQKLIGKTLQVFYDHAVVMGTDLQGGLDPATVELRVTLETLTLEELTRVWMALNSDQGYQLSISYQVTVVEIDSEQALDTVAPVRELDARHHLIIESNLAG